MQHHYQDLITLFEQTFYREFNTRLVKGDDEPIYLPASEQCDYHQVVFAHGYYESAFHEISHWCHAGKERRLLEDFGYWYEPDGRDEKQQQKFEQVEIIPQAIEWAFNVAVKKKFNTSADNLNGHQGDLAGFKNKVYHQVLIFLDKGFPPRAQLFIQALAEFYQSDLPLTAERFDHQAITNANSGNVRNTTEEIGQCCEVI